MCTYHQCYATVYKNIRVQTAQSTVTGKNGTRNRQPSHGNVYLHHPKSLAQRFTASHQPRSSPPRKYLLHHKMNAPSFLTVLHVCTKIPMMNIHQLENIYGTEETTIGVQGISGVS
jgi:hypothetical protein